ncbi:MAG: hypothetical protein RL017_250 [Pseudomonadota bacterium]|jgi:DUF1365 family protein|nr:DUF1365 domain-containing protein [Burkholderiales bacterium]
MKLFYNNALCIGKLWHRRFEPKQNYFEYKINMWLLDLDKIDELNTNSRLINTKKWAIYRFSPKKYLRGGGKLPIKQRLQLKLAELGATLEPQDKVYLLGQVSNLGVYFSPLNLYLVVNAVNELKYILAEGSNIPWKERCYYLLDPQQKHIISKKKLHVSPFMHMNEEYRWHFNFTEETIDIRIDTYEEGRDILNIGFSCSLVKFEDKNFSKTILTAPINVYKIVIGIYFEAFRLLLKGLPFTYHPKNK